MRNFARSVLLVDPDVTYRSSLARALRIDHGLHVVETASALGALTLLAAQSFDLVASEYRMPGLDGVALLEVVGTRWPATCRALVTAESTGEMVRFLSYRVLDKSLWGWFVASELAELTETPPSV